MRGGDVSVQAVFTADTAAEILDQSLYLEAVARSDRQSGEALDAARTRVEAEQQALAAEESLLRVQEQQRQILAEVEALRDQQALVLAADTAQLEALKASESILHQGGDRLLKEATAAWRQRLRETDLLARYGGEEFGVLFLDSTFPQVADFLGRFRAVNPLGQTFSGGVAQWEGSESPERLVARADRALYNAKQAGRDRIETVIPPAAAGRDRPAESEALGSSDTAASNQEPSQPLLP